jgi:hypothetical protein
MSNVMNDVEDEIRAIERTTGRIVTKQEAHEMAFKKMSCSC